MRNGADVFEGDLSQNVIYFLDGVIKFDRNAEEHSGSGTLGVLCLTPTSLVLCITAAGDIPQVLSEKYEQHLIISLICVKNAVINIDHKCYPFSDVKDVPETGVQQLIIQCKDFREYTLDFQRCPNPHRMRGFMIALFKQLYTVDNNCHFGHEKVIDESINRTVHTFLDKKSWEVELARLGLTKWSVMEGNKDFGFCPFLSPYCVRPMKIKDEVIERASTKYKDKRYISWCWSDPEQLVSLLRCSEPVQESDFDQNYLNKILNTMNQGQAKKHSVISTAVLKKSCPSELQIAQSFNLLWEVCMKNEDSNYFFKGLESSNWLLYVRTFIRGSRHIARTLKCDRYSVLVVDESGRDISCLVVSLVLILSDEYFRTLAGFANLINKEWIAAGYAFRSKFNSRHDTTTQTENAPFFPTFIMFLDCVHNIIQQYPVAFEFNTQFLVKIFDTLLSGRHSTFMFDCTKDFVEHFGEERQERMLSFWAAVGNSCELVNPLYGLKNKSAAIPIVVSDGLGVEHFDQIAQHTRSNSVAYSVSKLKPEAPLEKVKESRRTTMLFKTLKAPLLRKKKPKGGKKKAKITSSFFVDVDNPRERVSSINNIFQSKLDPINVSYCMIDILFWDNLYLRHADNISSEITDQNMHHNYTLQELISDIVVEKDLMNIERKAWDLESEAEIERSGSVCTLASDRMECSVHLSELDLSNDHDDKDNESAEELSLNGVSFTDSNEKRLPHVFEEPEMSNAKSPQTVELEIAEATLDIHDV